MGILDESNGSEDYDGKNTAVNAKITAPLTNTASKGKLSLNDAKANYFAAASITEDMEHNFFGKDKTNPSVIDDYIEKAIDAFHGNNMPQWKTTLYSIGKKIGINGYSLEAKKILRKAEKTVAILQKTSDTLDSKLSTEANSEGVYNQVAQCHEMVDHTAALLLEARNLRDTYHNEIEAKKIELGALVTEHHKAQTPETAQDIKYTRKKITELERETHKIDSNLKRIEGSLKIYYTKWKAPVFHVKAGVFILAIFMLPTLAVLFFLLVAML